MHIRILFNLVDNVANNAFYQGTLNPDGSVDYAFSLARPAASFNTDLKVRLYEDPLTDLSGIPVTLNITPQLNDAAGLSWIFADSGSCVSDVYGSTEPHTNFGQLQNDLNTSLYAHTLVVKPYYFFVEVACLEADTKQSNKVGLFDFAIVAGE